MAFGQQAGPPATGKQVQELLGLLQEAGHTDFRDARGPLGFTQRQAGGKFTVDEATAFIDRLQQEEFDAHVTDVSHTAPSSATTPTAQQTLRHVPTELLAAELRRRGWTVRRP